MFKDCLTGVTTSHQITSVAVYYNNAPIGFFDLPATIPILATGRGELGLAPGVAVNGFNSLAIAYPFYRTDTASFTAQPGKVINYTPTTCFYSDTKVQARWNFEGNTGFARWSGNRDIQTVQDPALVFEGHGTGSIVLTAVGDSSVDSTTKTFPIPKGSAFIEFDYKSTVPFYVGLQANLSTYASSQPYFLAGIYPSDHWQKFYLNVADFNGQYQGTSYNFYVKAVLDGGQKTGQLLIDNIQLVTF